MAQKNQVTNMPSDQTRLLQGVTEYETATGASIADYEKAISDKVKELSQGIVSGMTDQEKALLEGQITDLTNRANQARAATTGAYDFSGEQIRKVADYEKAQIAAAQQNVLQQAAATLGATGQQLAPGGMTAAQQDAMIAAQQQGAANVAFLGGAAAAPSEFLTQQQRGAEGLTSVSGLARELYTAGLEAARASSMAQTASSQVNLETALRNQALQAAMEREEKQRQFVRDFELAGFKSVLDQKLVFDTKVAELRANAASADTRDAKQKFNDDLAKLRAEEAIKLANNLKIIKAQNAAKGSAAPKLSPEQQRLNTEVVGSTSKFATYVDQLLTNKPTKPKDAQFIKGQKDEGKFYVTGGQVIRQYVDPKTMMPVTEAIPLNNVLRILNETAGYALLNNPTRAQLKTIVSNNLALLQGDKRTWLATQYLLGTSDAGQIADLMLSKTPGVKQNPYAGLNYGQLGTAYNDLLKSYGVTTTPPKTTTKTNTPTPKPTPNPKPTPKK